jgi:hypothetical protein
VFAEFQSLKAPTEPDLKILILSPTNIVLPIPTPPEITTAPVDKDVEFVADVTNKSPLKYEALLTPKPPDEIKPPVDQPVEATVLKA